MNHYRFYNLVLATPFPCPELSPSGTVADVVVQLAAIDDQSLSWKEQGVCYKVSENDYLLDVPGVARYLLSGGLRITIEKYPDAEDDAVRLFIYNDLAAVLLMQRGMLVLKGSAVAKDGKAYLLLGSAASGKSLAAAALEKRGFGLVTDTVCALGLRQGVLTVLPGLPFWLLWHKGLELLARPAEGLKPVRNGMHKFFVPAAEDFCTEAVPVAGICLLKRHTVHETVVTVLDGAGKLFAILNHQYRPNLAYPMGMPAKVNALATFAARRTTIANLRFCMADSLFEACIDTLARCLS